MNLDSTQREAALKLLISTFKEKARQKLKNSGRGIFTEKLLDSIDGEVDFVDGGYHFFVSMEHYGLFIDEGVNGVGYEKTKRGNIDNRFKSNRPVVKGSPYSFKDKKPPFEAVKPWATAHNLNPWAVQNSIYRKGIKPIKFFQETIDYEADKITEYMAEIEAQILLNNFLKD
jgi:hypothetical protein